MSEPISIAESRTGEGTAYLAYGRKRRAADPAVVLLHGFCGSSAYWEETLPHLGDAGRFIVPDLRGHGRSGAPEGDVYRMEDFADDLARLLDALGEREAVVLGHSLGGYVTLAFAERYPGRLRGFGLIHSTALPDTEEAKAGRDRTAARLLREGAAPFANELALKLFAAENRARMADKVARVAAIGCGTSPAGAARTALGMKVRPDRSGLLRDPRFPVLLVAGEGDEIVAPQRTFLDIERPGLKKVLLSGCGHMSMLEAPAKLAEAIAGFVEEAAAARN
ncbi:MAG: alpha/beta hydrolase [Thermobacillus sp. ZCTH02-B1]|uniref:alpha/beta fold hydrolase n=1 Tax=Thermobacillus sp. ZCTH02-B1 TaxID=1858795 RepID=UPI000B54CAD0|nr:alpha/beta hydrolase [Thermobacillus sp. ZCTH02-B1]OUM95320.1 MAG: alpha/beta hydrolase [Thermobacillus sp. ZCTH02-B1]